MSMDLSDEEKNNESVNIFSDENNALEGQDVETESTPSTSNTFKRSITPGRRSQTCEKK